MAKEPLRGGEFILKTSSCAAVFTPEDFSEEQRMMRDAVREFVDREIVPRQKDLEQHNYDLTVEILNEAAKLGFLGVSVPEKYEGLGMDFVSSMIVTDYISGATGSIATAYGAHSGIGTLPIVLYGTEDQKQKYLPKLATGEWLGAYALTEPAAGSDANAGKTSAKLQEDGTHYLINGQKMWISNSGFAHTFIVFARIEKDQYLSAFIIEYHKDRPNGIRLGKEEEKLGIHSSSTRQVFFDNTKVPAENLLFKRGKGFKIAMNILNIGRIKLGAGCLDAQRRITTAAVNYANERKQFGTTIAHFEAIKGKLAEMATAAYADESAIYRTAKLIQDRTQAQQIKGKTAAEAERVAVEEFAVECSLLKVNVSENIQRCSDEGIQIYGGIGFSKDTTVEAAWRDARITRIYEGTNEINRMHAVGMLFKKALQGELDLLSAAQKVQEELTSLPDFEKPDFNALFDEEKALLEKMKKAFLMIAGSAIKKYGDEIDKHQHILLAIADILIQPFLAEAVLWRTAKKVENKGEEQHTAEIAMTKLKFYQAMETVQQKGREAIISFTSGDQQHMLLIGLKRFTNYQNYPNISALKNRIADKLIAENKYCF